METQFEHNGRNITAKNVMIDLEGWLEEGVDVCIEGKFVGSLVGWSAKSRGLLKKIVEQWKLNEL